VFTKIGGNRIQLRLYLSDADTGPEARYCGAVMFAARGLIRRVPHPPRPQLSVSRFLEIRGHHADDSPALVLQDNRLADYLRIAGKA